jgi:mannose/cellobiose epimerase-like protein (N-acyl-D-glucosamine 2-epimerase family)
MVVNYCRAYQLFGAVEYRQKALHGLRYVVEQHWDARRQAYNWILSGTRPVDQTNHCYGLAFVLLMYSEALKAKLIDDDAAIDKTFEILESRFWLVDDGLYADEASPDWSDLSDYRGQNANMHTCEAMLAAFDATANERYVDRACALARKFTVDLARKSDNLVWEHFTKELEVDWDYTRTIHKISIVPGEFSPAIRPSGPSYCSLCIRFGLKNGCSSVPPICSTGHSRSLGMRASVAFSMVSTRRGRSATTTNTSGFRQSPSPLRRVSPR